MKRWCNVAMIVLTFPLAGCSDDPFSSVSGEFALESITVISATTLTVTPPDITGSFTLNSNGTFSFSVVSTPLNINQTGSGTFSVLNTEITLTHNTGVVETALLSADGLTITLFDEVEEGTTLAARFTKM